MGISLTIDFNEPVPVFPLPGCVLLPHATIPLHIFEPRYRQMTADALAGRRLIAMATFAGDDWKTHYLASPPLRAFVCVGYIVHHQQMDDGRYQLLLQGLCRAHIVEEVTDQTPLPYRSAVLHPLPAPSVMEGDLADRRQTMIELLDDPLLRQLTAVQAIHQWLSDDIPTPVAVDLATMTLCEQTQPRYDMLQEPDPQARIEKFLSLLRTTRQTLDMAGRLTPPDLPDHMTAN